MAFDNFKRDLHGRKDHPGSHAAKENISLAHLKPRVEGFSIHQLEIRRAL